VQIHGEKQDLVEIGQAVLRVVSPRATQPVLGGVRINAGASGVEFAATDLEIYVTTTHPFAVVEEGSVVVPGRLFGEILRSLPGGKVVITGQNGQIRIESGQSEFTIRGFEATEFPNAPEAPAGFECLVPGAGLAKALSRVVRAASTDEGRPVLTGVLWAIESGALKLIATDSYRLAVAEVIIKEGPPQASAIIPSRALAELARHIVNPEDEVNVWLGDNQAAFTVGNFRLVTRLIEGEFPNWRHLIPQEFENRFVMNRKTFAEAVERVALVAQPTTPVKFHLDRQAQLTASEAGVADALETIEQTGYAGDPMVIAFNPKFFLDGLEGIESDEAVLEVIDPAKPAVLRTDGSSEFLYLLMPVRLPN